MAFEFLDVINPAMYMHPLIATLLISILVTVLMTYVYKWMTDQKEMKELKDKIKKYSDDMKKEKKDPKKVMEFQKKAMQVNMQYFTKSMKPTLITFIPLILIFAWLNASLSYEPIKPGQEFTTTVELNNGVIGTAEISTTTGLQAIGESIKNLTGTNNTATWALRGNAGEHSIEYKVNGNSCADCRKTVLITDKQKYSNPIQFVQNHAIKRINIDNKPLKVVWILSWIWVYIIISIVLSMALRKVLKIY